MSKSLRAAIVGFLFGLLPLTVYFLFYLGFPVLVGIIYGQPITIFSVPFIEVTPNSGSALSKAVLIVLVIGVILSPGFLGAAIGIFLARIRSSRTRTGSE